MGRTAAEIQAGRTAQSPPPKQLRSRVSSRNSWAFQLLKYLAELGEGLRIMLAVHLQSQTPPHPIRGHSMGYEHSKDEGNK